jgi:hypothetical protein
MKFRGSFGFREIGERNTQSGNKAAFKQTVGSNGDPRNASFEKLFCATIAEYPFVQGKESSADIDRMWLPSESETEQLVQRAVSTFFYWLEGCYKNDIVDGGDLRTGKALGKTVRQSLGTHGNSITVPWSKKGELKNEFRILHRQGGERRVMGHRLK